MLTALARRLAPVVTLLTVVALVFASPGRVLAAPADDEGGTPSLREVLDSALKDYTDAKGRLDASLARQTQLNQDIQSTELRLTLLRAEVNVVAAASYRGSRLNMLSALLDGSTSGDLLQTSTTVQYMANRDDRQLRELTAAQATHADQVAALATEIKLQQQQLAEMEKKKKQAEDAVRRAGGGQAGTNVVPGKATAKAAPRNSDGSFPNQGCSQDDPTTSGCISPRTLHAYNEARLAGYTRYTSCHRGGGSGEHPSGRACDFSSNKTTFLNSRATGDDKAYGDRLAGWLTANANALGVLYVIWYKQIWQSGSGWKSYGGDGTPAGDHYNHVHLSMR